MTPEQCASVAMDLLVEPKYGDGSVVEVMLVEKCDDATVNIRDMPLEALYLTADVVGEDKHLLEEEEKFTQNLKNMWRPWFNMRGHQFCCSNLLRVTVTTFAIQMQIVGCRSRHT